MGAIDAPALSSYDELIDVIENLPVLVRETRRREGLSLRSASEICEVGFNTITRFENGDVVHSENLIRLLRFVAVRGHRPLPTSLDGA